MQILVLELKRRGGFVFEESKIGKLSSEIFCYLNRIQIEFLLSLWEQTPQVKAAKENFEMAFFTLKRIEYFRAYPSFDLSLAITQGELCRRYRLFTTDWALDFEGLESLLFRGEMLEDNACWQHGFYLRSVSRFNRRYVQLLDRVYRGTIVFNRL